MNCETVRALLPERALGVTRDAGVERHLQICAACRQEASGLDRAAATMAFALAPEDVPFELEDRTVVAIHEAQAHGRPGRRSPRRRALATALAAAAAIGLLWGGSVFAARQGRLDPTIEAQRQKNEFANFLAAIAQSEVGADASAMLGVLSDPSGGPARGSAMALVDPRGADRILVMANGVESDASLPFSVRAADGNGHYVWVGAVIRLTPTGGFTTARIVDVDLEGYVNVTVRDLRGRVVLSGALAEQASLPSPAG